MYLSQYSGDNTEDIDMNKVFQKQGRDEALKFPLHDTAETTREKGSELVENAGSTTATTDSVVNGGSIQGQAATGVLTVVREARTPVVHQELRRCCDVSEDEFERR